MVKVKFDSFKPVYYEDEKTKALFKKLSN